MATGGRRKNPHQRLDEAARYMGKLEQRLKAAEQQVEAAHEQISGFSDMVKDLSRSMQRNMQGQYRSLDERIGRVEGAGKDLDKQKSARRKPPKKEEDSKKTS